MLPEINIYQRLSDDIEYAIASLKDGPFRPIGSQATPTPILSKGVMKIQKAYGALFLAHCDSLISYVVSQSRAIYDHISYAEGIALMESLDKLQAHCKRICCETESLKLRTLKKTTSCAFKGIRSALQYRELNQRELLAVNDTSTFHILPNEVQLHIISFMFIANGALEEQNTEITHTLHKLQMLYCKRDSLLFHVMLPHWIMQHNISLAVLSCRLGDPEIWSIAPHLKHMDLEGCQRITVISKMPFSRLTRLESLNLAACQIATDDNMDELSSVIADLSGLTNLKTLDFSHQQPRVWYIADRYLDLLGQITSLQTLKLWEWERQKMHPVYHPGLDNFQRLNLLELAISGDFNEQLIDDRPFSNLHTMELDGRNELYFYDLEKRSSLRKLVLHLKKIDQIPWHRLKNLTQLQKIDLCFKASLDGFELSSPPGVLPKCEELLPHLHELNIYAKVIDKDTCLDIAVERRECLCSWVNKQPMDSADL
jgi:hypothetical protein